MYLLILIFWIHKWSKLNVLLLSPPQQKELEKVFQAAGQLASNLTFIVVSKRINTRVILAKPQGYDNPPPGCVVDSVVTLPER